MTLFLLLSCLLMSFYFYFRPDAAFSIGEIGFTLYHRKFASLSLNQEVRVTPYDPFSAGINVYIGTLNIQVKIKNFILKLYQQIYIQLLLI